MNTSLWDLPAADRRRIVPYPWAAPTAKEQEIAELRAEIEDIDEEISDLRSEVGGLEDRISDARSELGSAQERLRSRKKHLEDLL